MIHAVDAKKKSAESASKIDEILKNMESIVDVMINEACEKGKKVVVLEDVFNGLYQTVISGMEKKYPALNDMKLFDSEQSSISWKEVYCRFWKNPFAIRKFLEKLKEYGYGFEVNFLGSVVTELGGLFVDNSEYNYIEVLW